MINGKSIFRYRLIGKCKYSKEIASKIGEELNKGLSFIISEDAERIVHLRGKSKNWITIFFDVNGLRICIENKFFVRHCVIDQILTSLWANLLDFGEIRLEKFQLSKDIHNFLTFELSNITPVRSILKAEGPYLGTIFKPPHGLSLKKKIEIAKKFAGLGGAFIKEDETYIVDRNKLLNESKAIQKAINIVSDQCFYVPNVSHYLFDTNILKELYNVGIRVVMVNYLITGLPSVYKIRKKNPNILFWGHRVGYKAFEKYISMRVVATLAAYCGINLLHVGTPFLSMDEDINKTVSILEALKLASKNTIPIFTKTSTRLASKLIALFGRNIIVMACGDIRTNGYLDWEKIKTWLKVVRNE